ncbi:2,3,4,5-tetrahydropyridine-2,6-carboxylate N-succinyltransferase [Helicobacter mustelae]|uniref:Possible 2,3,4,5-tetrahydropyridine-2-carboxylate N-succinyltransferase n=1 Tax=Helicobacter mustelae (strain ATCC 43772 / CCUG 25715 / CIP 103759 / LMG 18044 / NCTC 12198 / R85-136P) TaxID=679897 RepID=D3UHQ9_HELM1|nr:2,3,4,5-tetrahydropyridine-2,6-carboxylate N-succinyltransferase [Helicobacter mustelae]CBG40031.1 possible 2,3,4,5-tetrahydropyridine-2-carboxylate N-succinyltransferase [Helicobacter mustelae 12198]SQH71544.1 2,3,4,5-tetrahydropyridine-2,6-carboxylate N-succinyltransferase [Helicobacter mustelae]STP12669.1 2,3,4,5-tetrahydropyridine-2,6-carboxylate N-succinyltransferase [Helicobacter mustelae]
METFKKFVEKHQARECLGFGVARVDLGKRGNVLCATYPVLNWKENFGSYAVFDACKKSATLVSQSQDEAIYSLNLACINEALEIFAPFLPEALRDPESHRNIQVLLELKKILSLPKQNQVDYRLVFLYADAPCKSVESAYMKLLALSLGKAPLRSLHLDGIFGLLSNVAWSGNKPYELEDLRQNEIAWKLSGTYPHIDFVDKFPRYLMQVIPQYDNIRILDSAKTRFGAYLGKGGYTQMPGASYVNFNAGVEGACMNEGRISSSVIIGEGSDVGGGASILGVLSGGNSEPISIGRNCLLGVNSSTGISLGDGCIVDGGIAVLSGTVFEIQEQEAQKIQALNPSFLIHENGLYKGRELSGLHGLHFRQDSKSGKMVAFKSNQEITLNKDLH